MALDSQGTADPFDLAALFARGRTVGDYRLLHELGRGGMGTVWEAEQISLPRRVALKILPPGYALSEEALPRFKREAEAGARLTHDGIVAVYSFGREGPLWYIAQEKVGTGRTLADAILEVRRTGRPPADWYRQVAALVERTAEALHYAHEQGVVHRDVKPSNVLLTPGGAPKVGDFGLARIAALPGISRTGDLTGTAFYMSPEQAAGAREVVGPASDVFALGATFYECLTLVRPFDGDTSHEVLERIRSLDPKDPREQRSRVPRDLAVVCMKALEKRVERRYASAAELAADLRRFLAHEPVRAQPPGVWVRARKWTRRHPLAAGAGGVGWAALLVVTALLLQNRTARLRAEQAEQQAQQETAALRRVTDYVIGIFRSARPSHVGRRPEEITAREILENGIATVRQDLAGEPAVLVRMLDVLGEVQLALGRFEEARELLAEALEREIAHAGARTSLARHIRSRLGHATSESGDHATAIAQLEGLYSEYVSEQGEATPGTLFVGATLGGSLLQLGRVREAEALLARVVELGEERLGAGHETVLRAASYLGMAWHFLGRLEEAEPLLRTYVEHTAETLGRFHPNNLSARHNYANLLLDRSEFEAAESAYREIADDYAIVAGERHPNALRARSGIANALYLAQQLDDAGAAYEAVLDEFEQVFGADHVDTLILRHNYAQYLHDAGRHDEAAAVSEANVAAATEKLGERSAHTLSFRNQRAKALAALDREQEAYAELRAIMELARDERGEPGGDAYWNAHEVLLHSLGGWERWEEAERVGLALIAARQKEGIPVQIHRARALLLQVYAAAGRFDDAVRVGEESLAALRTSLGAEHALAVACEIGLVGLQLRAGRTEEARARALVLDARVGDSAPARRTLDGLLAELGRAPTPTR